MKDYVVKVSARSERFVRVTASDVASAERFALEAVGSGCVRLTPADVVNLSADVNCRALPCDESVFEHIGTAAF